MQYRAADLADAGTVGIFARFYRLNMSSMADCYNYCFWYDIDFANYNNWLGMPSYDRMLIPAGTGWVPTGDAAFTVSKTSKGTVP
jgi:hypothetical protein